MSELEFFENKKNKYFLAFEYYSEDRSINRFSYGINEIDLNTESITDVARNIIRKSNPEISLVSITIKINSFNRV